MARKTKLQIVREAIAIQGYIELPGPKGRKLRVRSIDSGPGGVWLLDHYTEDMMSRLRIPRKNQDRVVAMAQEIIDRKEEILAEKERTLRSALDL